MPLKICYLDDEPLLLEMFSDTFESQDVLIKTFNDANIAIDFMKKEPPDLVFLDYRLPGTTGDIVAQKLDPSIPKILVTGDLSVNTNYKFEHIMPKPYLMDEMLGIIEQYLAAIKSNKET